MTMDIPLARSPDGQTATAIILATEKLVAQHGANAVSLRQINSAANVRNASAVHYHFGSRDGLFTAVYHHRLAAIDKRRLRELRRLKREGRLGDCRAIIAVMVYALADEMIPREEGNYYIRFIERCVREYGDRPSGELDRVHRIGLRIAGVHLARILAYLPPQLVEMRLLECRTLALYSLASMEADLERDPAARAPLPLRIEALIDGMAAMLLGPVSPATLAELTRGTDAAA